MDCSNHCTGLIASVMIYGPIAQLVRVIASYAIDRRFEPYCWSHRGRPAGEQIMETGQGVKIWGKGTYGENRKIANVIDESTNAV